MTLFPRLRAAEQAGLRVNVVLAGAGLMGRGLIRQVDLTPAMRIALVVNRTAQRAVQGYAQAGYPADSVVVSDDAVVVQSAIDDARPCVTRDPAILESLRGLDVAVELTGAVDYGARVALHAIGAGLHVVMMNAEADATVGPLLKVRADAAGVVYTATDGDQPGVLKRLINYVEGLGFETVAAVNCKGFLDRHATPEGMRGWAERQCFSPEMTTAFTDGTKMHIENAVLANGTGLVPDRRGMHGVSTSLATALADVLGAITRRGVVEYTLGGDFRGGVFMIGRTDDRDLVRITMRNVKMGDGPDYLFHRPYHLCNLETPISIAEAALDRTALLAPIGAPVAEVIALAKRELKPGDVLGGLGGIDFYGEIDTVAGARGLLPVGLAEGATVTRALRCDEPITLDAVDLAEDRLACRLRSEQDALWASD